MRSFISERELPIFAPFVFRANPKCAQCAQCAQYLLINNMHYQPHKVHGQLYMKHNVDKDMDTQYNDTCRQQIMTDLQTQCACRQNMNKLYIHYKSLLFYTSDNT